MLEQFTTPLPIQQRNALFNFICHVCEVPWLDRKQMKPSVEKCFFAGETCVVFANHHPIFSLQNRTEQNRTEFIVFLENKHTIDVNTELFRPGSIEKP